ncbi:hypothetical protein B9Z55_006907 [Caenorhabditis nigoni]|uniref:BTB domain-containing protein n=1 Tax=Caenorhabditis nigoni TaxID=1611254 RepID=A0A2G5V766_9PELO|nr:hypothetical protein B9Z55_006907 [Caenorhabditis nigoni]
MDQTTKEFVIRHVIEDVPKMVEDEKYTVTERHFGVPWTLEYCHFNRHLACHLVLINLEKSKEWIIKTENNLKLISVNGTMLSIKENCKYDHRNMSNSWGWSDIVRWSTLEKYYAIDGKVTIEAHVVIKEMHGFEKENLMKFDESVAELSDIVLIVNDRKFYLSKYFLALRSSYFKTLFTGKFDESEKSEIQLNGIEADHFQNFLDLLHGESSIDDDTVTGILHLADMYDAPIAMRRSEEYLLEKSKKNTVQKLQLALRYNLEHLKNKILSEITTISDIELIMTANLPEMNASTYQILLQKCIAFANKS